MALRQSTGLRNFKLRDGAFKMALTNGILKIYTGIQPASADDAPTGTLLVSVTENAGNITPEVLSYGSFTLSGSGGQVNTVTVNSVVIMDTVIPYTTDLATTAAAVALAINNSMILPHYTATSSAGTVTIKAMPGTGTIPNTYTVACGVSGGTLSSGTPTAFANGVAAINGLQFGSTSSGVLVPSGTWKGIPVASGTAGWFRHQGSIVDSGASSTTLIRLDGNISTVGANMNLNTTTISAGVPFTVSNDSTITDPAS